MAKFSHEDFEKMRAEVIARAWTDEEFKKKLLANPREVAKEEYGLDLPPDVEIKWLENTDKKFYFVLPQKPKKNLSESELKTLSAASIDNMGYY